MGFFSEFSNFRSASFAAEPKETIRGAPMISATSAEDGKDKRKRTDRKKLEEFYLTDPQTLNQIDLYATIPIQAGFRIEAEKKGSQPQYDEFFEDIGKFGIVTGKKQLITRMLSDAPLYGYSYIERVFGIEKIGKIETKRIIDLKPVDAKLMDYARDDKGTILVDEFQRPIGYTMKVGYGVNARSDPVPRGYPVSLDGEKIFIDAERIACILFKPFGNGFESIGTVETSATDIERKQRIKEAIANVIHNNAAYNIYAVVGDAQRAASKKVQEDTLTALQQMSFNRFGVFNYPTELNTLKVEHSPQADEHLRFLRSEQSTAGGIALGIAVGSGEAINRQTMAEQQVILDMKFDGWIERFCEQFNQKILDYLYRYNGYGSKAKLIWNDIILDDKHKISEQLFKAVQTGIIAPEEARKYLLLSYSLDRDDKAYEEMKEDKKKSAELAQKKMNEQTNQNNQSSQTDSKKAQKKSEKPSND